MDPWKIQDTVNSYQALIEIIEGSEDSDGICRLTKKEISNRYGKSYTATRKKIDFLLSYDIIRRQKQGYKNTGKDVVIYTPINLIPRVLELVHNHPDVFNKYIEQADMLGVTHRDIQVAWGFIGYFFGPKYPDAKSLSFMDDDVDGTFF